MSDHNNQSKDSMPIGCDILLIAVVLIIVLLAAWLFFARGGWS